MAIFDIKSIKNNKDTNAVIGHNKVTLFSQRLSQIKETNITSESNDWQQVIEQIGAMQKVISQVPDEHEEIREQQLIQLCQRRKQRWQNCQKSRALASRDSWTVSRHFLTLQTQLWMSAVKSLLT
jgi:hypothetical protein